MTSPNPAPIDDQLLRYFAIRSQQRADRVAETVEALSERERRLVREAAVMGYVTGVRCGPHRAQIPPDWAILAEVVDGCLGMPDLYPLIARAEEINDVGS